MSPSLSIFPLPVRSKELKKIVPLMLTLSIILSVVCFSCLWPIRCVYLIPDCLPLVHQALCCEAHLLCSYSIICLIQKMLNAPTRRKVTATHLLVCLFIVCLLVLSTIVPVVCSINSPTHGIVSFTHSLFSTTISLH